MSTFPIDRSNLQQVFEYVAKHLFDQGAPARDLADASCFYRQPNAGFKCAAGCLIADDEYVSGMENIKFTKVVEDFCLHDFTNEETTSKYLVEDLQRMHDSDWKRHMDSGDFRALLRLVAIKYNLEHSFLDTLSFKDC